MVLTAASSSYHLQLVRTRRQGPDRRLAIRLEDTRPRCFHLSSETPRLGHRASEPQQERSQEALDAKPHNLDFQVCFSEMELLQERYPRAVEDGAADRAGFRKRARVSQQPCNPSPIRSNQILGAHVVPELLDQASFRCGPDLAGFVRGRVRGAMSWAHLSAQNEPPQGGAQP